MKQHIIIEHNMGIICCYLGKNLRPDSKVGLVKLKIINYRLGVELTMPKNC